MKILFIEDDKELALLTKNHLGAFQMHVDIAYTGEEGVRLVKTGYYDVVLVDLLLNIALNGLEVIRHIRKVDKSIPLITVTALQDIETKVSTFAAGADDYIIKPFHFQELAARVHRLYRRINRPYLTQVSYRGLTYDVERRCIHFDKQKVFLKNKEATLFEYFLHHPERTLSRNELINSVWHTSVNESSNVVDVSVRKLRQKVDENLGLKLIHTVHGMGYRFAL
ncbi:MAG: response regulator transcription factor [Candidatus Abawacabacteria bacterium]|nr:response regulator transcription factor [Candidatus Abawacabacteria bacterium]